MNNPFKFETAPTDIVSVMNDAITATTKVNLDGATSSDSEILTVLDVARFLRVPKSTVYKLARLGQLPASKSESIGGFSDAISTTGCTTELSRTDLFLRKHLRGLQEHERLGRPCRPMLGPITTDGLDEAIDG